MTPSVLLLVLLAALLHASWNALIKVGGDGLVRLGIVNITASVCCVPVLFIVDFPQAEAWPYLIASIIIHQAYYGFLVQGYKFGDLSLVYPIARGIAPLLVAVGAYLLAAEQLSGSGVIAVILICSAILSLAFERGQQTQPKAVLFALCTGATIAAYTVCDGLGGRLSGDVFGYIAWLFFLEGQPIFLVALWLRRRALVYTLLYNWRAGTAGGVFAVTAYGLVIWAMSSTPMTFVSAVRETSVLVAAFIGTRLLREGASTRQKLTRLLAAAGVVGGVVLLQLSRL